MPRSNTQGCPRPRSASPGYYPGFLIILSECVLWHVCPYAHRTGAQPNFTLTAFSEVRLILQRHFALASSAASILGTLQRSLIIFATH